MRVVPATPSLVPFLLERMGPERVAALAEMCGDPWAHIVGHIGNSTWTFAGIDHHGVVNMGGVMPTDVIGTGYVWQLITDGVRENKRAYIVQGRWVLAEMLRRYPRLVTMIETEYHAAHRHIRRLGGVVGQEHEIGGVAMRHCERTR